MVQNIILSHLPKEAKMGEKVAATNLSLAMYYFYIFSYMFRYFLNHEYQ